MSRLPIPGQDSGTWGDILNDYLLQAHSSDGTLKPSSVTASHLAPGSVKSTAIQDGSITTAKLANTAITTTKLDSSIQTSLSKADSAVQPTDLGTSATLDVGTTSGTVAAGDDTRITGAQSAATLDTDTAALIADPGSATRSGLTSTFAARGDAAFTAVRSALAGGRSCAIWATGDSTMEQAGDGTSPLEVFAAAVAVAHPDHHVRIHPRDEATDTWGIPVVVQEATGRRYASFTTRSRRWRTETAPQLSGDTIDLRALIAPNDWTSGADQTIVTRASKEVAGVISNDLQFKFVVKSTGALSFHFAQAGGFTFQRDSSELAGGTDGVPMWVRVVFTQESGVGGTAIFYTAPAADPTDWTQLGTTLTWGWMTDAWLTPTDDSFFEIGGTHWQPLSNPFAGKIWEVHVLDGEDGPDMVPCLPELWQRYAAANETLGGSPTVTIVNACRGGQNLADHTNADRLRFETADFGQTVAIFCEGHNDGGLAGRVDWMNPYEDWVDAVLARTPDAAPVLVRQNPYTSAWANATTTGPSLLQRGDEVARLAAKRGWSLADVYAAFEATGNPDTYVQVDGLHPTDAGYEISAQTLLNMLGPGYTA